MEEGNLIIAADFCSVYDIDITFLNELNNRGMIRLEPVDEVYYIREGQIPVIEKIILLYYELDINLEGIETIMHLLEREELLQQKIDYLLNRLKFYEDT